MIPSLQGALDERGYDTLTPVQEAVTAPELAESDLLVSAQTGSGKTVGFGLAIGPTLLGEDDTLGPPAAPLALIVAPTRELAFQVTRELSWLYARTGAQVVSCVGGMDMRDERRALDRGAHIVVGTPGRLRDHIQRNSLDLGAIRAVVLDEADEMLDLGFREDLEFMLAAAPETRRTLMFSATVPPMIATLAKRYQHDAVRVTTLSGQTQHADIAYQALRVAPQDAENAIVNVLRYHEAQNAIVFANTRATVNRLTARFSNRGFAVVSLSGELSQTERTHALQAMRDGRARVCVATDVAARGIDLPNLELVVHAELPTNAEGLLHRSGRTGRAGRKGISALIVPPKALNRAERLLKSARVTAEWMAAPGADEILRRDEERLLADPDWDAEITPDAAAFADRLLAARSPQQIAAAYLRLYRTRHSAPEDLSDPDLRAPRAERAPFGPSAWVTLSVGREDRAEARWILPLLCRAGGLTKEAIGAIRVQQTETHVEIAEASLPGFLAALGNGGALENGVTARTSEGPPAPGSPRPTGPREGRPARAPRPRDAAPAPEEAAPPPASSEPAAAPASAAPDTSPDKTPAAAVPRSAPAPAEPDTAADSPPASKRRSPPDAAATRSGADASPGAKPPRRDKRTPSGPAAHPAKRGPKGRTPDAPADAPVRQASASDTSKRFTPPGQAPDGKPGRKPFGKPGERRGDSPSGKPFGKPGGKPGDRRGDKPFGKAGGKDGDRRGDKAAGKPFGKPGDRRDENASGKPFGKPGGKTFGKGGKSFGGKPDRQDGPKGAGPRPKGPRRTDK